MRSSKLIIESNARQRMPRFGFGHKFYDLNYFETFSNIPLIHYTFEVIIKKIIENHQVNVNITCFKLY